MEIVVVLVAGLVVGALARLALPGPDPIPLWATVLLGVAGGVVGALVALPTAGPEAAFLVSVIAATLLLLAYRRLVQKRPITGPGARGGRARDPEPGSEEATARLRRLEELRDQGVISDEEFALKRDQLVARI